MTSAAVAIVLAAGAGDRLGAGKPKGLVALHGQTLVQRAVAAAASCPQIGSVVVAVPSGFEQEVGDSLRGSAEEVRVIAGGTSRQESVRRALEAIGEAEVVAVHDAARCLATSALFSSVIDALAEADGVVPVLRVSDTVKRVEGDVVMETLPREGLVLAQTPQAFRAAALKEAHAKAGEEAMSFTDDAALMEWAGRRVIAVDGEDANVKITTAVDLALADRLLGDLP